MTRILGGIVAAKRLRNAVSCASSSSHMPRMYHLEESISHLSEIFSS